MTSRLSTVLMLLCLFGLANAYAYADRPIAVINNLDKPFDLNAYVEVIEDFHQKYILEDIVAGTHDTLWHTNKERYLIGRNTEGQYWFRITINWQIDESINSFLFIDNHIQLVWRFGLVIPQSNGHAPRVIKTGTMEPYNNREIEGQLYAYPLTLEKNKNITLYGWFSNQETSLPTTIPLFLYSEKQLHKKEYQYNNILIAFYAVMAALMLYNLFLFATLRESVYGLYLGSFTGAIAICAGIDGSAARWLFPDNPLLNFKIITISSTAGVALYFSFVVCTLDRVSFWPKFNRIYWFVIATGFAGLCYPIFYDDPFISNIIPQIYFYLVYPINVALIITGIVKRIPTAVFLFLGVSCMLTGGIGFSLVTQGLLPIDNITLWCMHFGVLSEAILLSLLLAARTRIAKSNAVQHLKMYETIYQESIEGRFQYSFVDDTFKCNRSMTTICGLNSAEKFIADNKILQLCDEATNNELIERLQLQGKVSDYEALIARYDTQQPAWVSINMRLLMDERGTPNLIEGSLVNISERKLKEEAMRERSLGEAEAKAKSRFFASMSHELRTPLTAILGYAEIAKQAQLDERRRIQHIATIERSGKHLLQLINDILDLSKIEAQKLDVEPLHVSTIDIIRDVEDHLSILAIKKDITFETIFRFPIPKTIITDPTRLKQILINICGNSVKFTERGGVTVETYYDKNQDRLCFAVKDTGIGLKPEQIDKLFGAFVQAETSTTRNYGGTGLGLYLSMQIAEKLGGGITVESVFGEGSTFIVSISPGNLSHVTWLTEITENDQHTTTLEAPILTGKILYAEDNLPNQLMVSEIIERTGCTISVAGNGHDALRMARSHHFDLIFTDIRMPTMDGIEFAKTLKAEKPHIPIIALTAEYSVEFRLELENVGFTQVLAKPVSIKHLYNSLTENLPRVSVQNAVAHTTKHNNLIVLLADDNPVNQQIIEYHIKRFGADLVIAKDGLEAIAKTLTESFSVILMDVFMPLLGGLETVELLRKKGINTPIYAFTAISSQDDTAKCLQAGCNGVLYKPLEIAKLNDILNITRIALMSQAAIEQNPSLAAIHKTLLSMEPKSLLVADDKEDNRELIHMLLEPYPITTSFAQNGQQAISLSQDKDFDGILLDVTMPTIGGIEAAQTIREKDRNTPIIFLTGHSHENYYERCKRVGGNSFINKPIDRELFWIMIADLLVTKTLREAYTKEFANDDNIDLNSLYAAADYDEEMVLINFEEFLKAAELIESRLSNNRSDTETLLRIFHDFINSCGKIYAHKLVAFLNLIEKQLDNESEHDAYEIISTAEFYNRIREIEVLVKFKRSQLIST